MGVSYMSAKQERASTAVLAPFPEGWYFVANRQSLDVTTRDVVPIGMGWG